MPTGTPSSTGRPALHFEIHRVCGSKDGEHLFVLWDCLALEKTPIDLVDLPHSVHDEVRDLIDLGVEPPLRPIPEEVL